MSPPARTWWYWQEIWVAWPVSISSRCCGLTKLSRPFSRIGLKVTILQPRRTASCRSCRKRGLLVPVFWPKKKIASQCSKSSTTEVPTGEPISAFRATDVVSWHMLELSGRLLCP